MPLIIILKECFSTEKRIFKTKMLLYFDLGEHLILNAYVISGGMMSAWLCPPPAWSP